MVEEVVAPREMPKSCGVKYPERCYEVHTTRVAWMLDELNDGGKYWWRTDEREQEDVVKMGRSKERAEPSGKREVGRCGNSVGVDGRCDPRQWLPHQWLEVLMPEATSDDGQQTWRSGVCLCSMIWRNLRWRL